MSNTLESIGERKLIYQYIAPHLSRDNSALYLDDCAALPIDDKRAIVVSSDQMPSHTFISMLGIGSYRDIGEFAVTSNLSDIAAVGASPMAFLLSIALPKQTQLRILTDILAGVSRACKKYKIKLIGGDTKESPLMNITGVAIGIANKMSLISRAGASPGDSVFISGKIGRILRSYLKAKKKMKSGETKPTFLSPFAGLELGMSLSKSNCCTSCIDLSDGLFGGLKEIAWASKCSFEIDISRLPVVYPHDKCIPYSDWLNVVLNVGGDFDLLFTMKEEKGQKIARKFKAFEIGRVIKRRKSPVQFASDKYPDLRIMGWEHFRSTEIIKNMIQRLV